ncbi:DUF3307 domain-containing protein [bacterium]|nr:DUF3307 domain-containing protein [bacterium]
MIDKDVEMKLLWILLLAHVVVDFILQSDALVAEKEKFIIKSFLHHTLTQFFVTFILLNLLNGPIVKIIFISLIVSISHLIIDLIMQVFKSKRFALLVFSLDQIAHFIILIFVSLLFINTFSAFNQAVIFVLQKIQPLFFESQASKLFSFTTIKFIIILCITVFVGSVFVKKILTDCKDLKDSEPDNTKSVEYKQTIATGKIIGYFERLIIFLLVLTNNIAATTWILTAKSIVRFDKIKKNEMEDGLNYAEYYLIGTLSSSAFAIIMGILGKELL